jgi:hypothetical protein
MPWMGSGAAGKAAFMLVREISVSADMMILCHRREGGCDVIIFVENCQETSRRDTAN